MKCKIGNEDHFVYCSGIICFGSCDVVKLQEGPENHGYSLRTLGWNEKKLIERRTMQAFPGRQWIHRSGSNLIKKIDVPGGSGRNLTTENIAFVRELIALDKANR